MLVQMLTFTPLYHTISAWNSLHQQHVTAPSVSAFKYYPPPLSPPLGTGDSCSTAMARLFHPGKCVAGHVTEVRGDEVMVDLPEGAVGRATTHTVHSEYADSLKSPALS